MSQTEPTLTLQQAIDLVESLPLDDQILLVDLIQKRLYQQQRQEIVREIQEIRQEVAQGNVKFGSVDEFLAELDD